MLTCFQNAKLRQRYTRAKQAQQHLGKQSRRMEAEQKQRQKVQDDAITAESNLISFVSSVCVSARVGFLSWQKLFLPGQWKKPVKTVAKTGKIKDTIN